MSTLTPMWLVVTLMFGQPVATLDDTKFRTESGCFLYMRAKYNHDLIDRFKLKCVSTNAVTNDWLKRLLLRRED